MMFLCANLFELQVRHERGLGNFITTACVAQDSRASLVTYKDARQGCTARDQVCPKTHRFRNKVARQPRPGVGMAINSNVNDSMTFNVNVSVKSLFMIS